MKKNLIRLFACVLALVCLISLAACSGGNTSSAGDKASSAPVSSAPVSSAVDSSAAASTPEDTSSAASAAGGLTLEDYVNSEEMQSQVSAMGEGFKDQGTVNVTAEGNTMIFTFAFNDLGDADLTELGTTLSQAMEADAISSLYGTLASELKKELQADDVSIKVCYATNDGTELCSKEFFPAE